MVRDSEETKRLLLEAARAEFAKHGVAGARVDRIAGTAGVSKERIYGHFGNKDALFSMVLSDALAEATATVEAAEDLAISEYVARKVDFHRAHPDFARLNLWETLSQETTAASDQRTAAYDAKASSMAAMLGTDETQARYALILALALSTIELTLPHIVQLILGQHYDADKLRTYLAEAGSRAVASPETE